MTKQTGRETTKTLQTYKTKKTNYENKQKVPKKKHSLLTEERRRKPFSGHLEIISFAAKKQPSSKKLFKSSLI